ncbi:hypothetical protein J2T49_000420 [Pseudomonas nitroreducens]|nr:hypothetical protein [Pseudomonas nitroreducens]
MKRYDTLVIEGAMGQAVPREVDGGRVVSWSRGHALAHADPIEQFVQDLIDGDFEDLPYERLIQIADGVTAKARRQRDNGFD